MFCGRGAEAPTGSWYKVEELSNVKVVKSKKEKMFVSNKDKYNFFFLFFSSSGMCLFDEVSSAVRCARAAGDQVKQPFVRAADKWLQSVKKKRGFFGLHRRLPTDAACPRVPSPLPEISGGELGEAIYNLT